MRNILLVFCFLSILASCKKNSFESYLDRKGLDNLVELKIYPNGNVLTTDGQSEVSFVVKAFVTVRNDNRLDTVIFKLTDKDFEKISIYTSDGTKVNDFAYRTATTNRNKETFIAKMGEVVSEPVEVRLEPVVNHLFTKKVIPVNVYILYQPLQEELANVVTNAAIKGMLDRVNQVFSNSLVNAPHAMDSQVEFRFSRKIVKNVGKLTIAELNKTILANYTKQPQDTLHIWFCNTNDSENSSLPKYKLDESFSMPGLNLSYVPSISNVNIKSPKDVGIYFPLGAFNTLSKGLNGSRFETALGRYFGLLTTESTQMPVYPASLDLDFCPDTYNYDNLSTGIEKRTIAYDKRDYLYFKSYNIMDNFSSATTITNDQIIRMRKVMEQCAFRQFLNQ